MRQAGDPSRRDGFQVIVYTGIDPVTGRQRQTSKPIGPRTIQGYRALAEARIKLGIGKLRLPPVDPPTLDRFYTALRKSGSLRKPGSPLSGAGSAMCTR